MSDVGEVGELLKQIDELEVQMQVAKDDEQEARRNHTAYLNKRNELKKELVGKLNEYGIGLDDGQVWEVEG